MCQTKQPSARLLLGTGICLVVERDPITLAKEVASLDYLSKGRVLFGIGASWNLEEMVHHGTDPTRRWKVMRERIEAMKTIWTRDEPAYQGEFVPLTPSGSGPSPCSSRIPLFSLAGMASTPSSGSCATEMAGCL